MALHAAAHGPRRVLDDVRMSAGERPLVHPHDHRLDRALDVRDIVGVRDHVAAADVDVVGEAQRDRERCVGVLEIAVERRDPRDAGALPRRQHDDLVARPHDPRRDLSAVATEVLVRPQRALHGKPEVDQVAVAADVDVLEVGEHGNAFEPRHPRASGHDIVADERADRNERQVGEAEAGGELGIFVAYPVEHRLVVADQVHLVDRDDDSGHAQQRGDESVALGLRLHAQPRVDENHREIGGRRAGCHVARVLDMARRVGNDEAAPRRGEVAVRDVDGDALLALGPKAVGDVRQIERRAVALGFPAQGVEVVVVERAGVVQQAADQRRLAVVDAAGGGEAQEVGLCGLGGGVHDRSRRVLRVSAARPRACDALR